MSDTNGKTILVTGATGQQGGAVARQLLAKGRRVRALTRKPEGAAAKELARLGAEVVQGDLDDVASLKRALEGAWGVFAVQNTWEAGVEREEEQGKRLAELAREAGVQHYVYTSVGSAHRSTGVPHFDNKWRVEGRVRELGFPSHTIIRPVFFMENLLGPWFLQGDKLVMALQPTTKLQMIAVEDIGKFGALAFERHEDLNRAEIDIAGDSVTLPEAAKILAEARGTKLEFVQAPIEEVRKASEDQTLMLEWFDRVGYDADVPALKSKYGIPLQSLAAWARSLPKP
jgi:uncharacterized protein YbjT (DUF2867 family)